MDPAGPVGSARQEDSRQGTVKYSCDAAWSRRRVAKYRFPSRLRWLAHLPIGRAALPAHTVGGPNSDMVMSGIGLPLATGGSPLLDSRANSSKATVLVSATCKRGP
ncbi:unnamed protein product [Clonostachys rosea]|uniref:Uncharacterized protein n=1 Tax=Bionectria ochroleuca TaxID=29856 RepID=A0ABY6U2P5_BIOOC|nr:unnamed protein product [Clonostachys rosea]